MSQRVSREDATAMMAQLQRQAAKDRNTHRFLYEQCLPGAARSSQRRAESGEVLHDMITALSLKLDFLQSVLLEQVLAKCSFLLTQFMKDYGVLMEAAVREVHSIVSFLKDGLRNLLSAILSLTSEKDLYAQKALALAKGFVASSNHSFDMLNIQPNFNYLDVISDLCFKSGVDVNEILNKLCVVKNHYSQCNGGDGKMLWNGNDDPRWDFRASKWVSDPSNEKKRSTGDTLGLIDSMYSQQLLCNLTSDVQKAIADSLIPDSVQNDDNGDVGKENDTVDEVLHQEASVRSNSIVIGERALKAAYTDRDKSALRIQRFVFICWVSKRRRRRAHVTMVHKFLMRAIYRMRAFNQMLKKRKINHSKLIINRTIFRYIELCKLKAKSATIIRSNLRKLFRNYLYQQMSSACRQGARRLIQREWALRHSDTDLRLLRIETYLSNVGCDNPVPFSIRSRPYAPLAKHEAYLSAQSWENIASYTKDELMSCNIHILEMKEIDDEQDGQNTTTASMARSLDVLESACMVNDVDVRARKRLLGSQLQHTHHKDRKQSKQGSRLRRATTNSRVLPKGFAMSAGSRPDSSIPPKRPGRRHSKAMEGPEMVDQEDVLVKKPDCFINASGHPPDSASTVGDLHINNQSLRALQSQLDTIKKSLEK